MIKPLQRRGSASGQINPVQPRGRPSEDVARRRAGRDSIPGPSDQNYNGEYKNWNIMADIWKSLKSPQLGNYEEPPVGQLWRALSWAIMKSPQLGNSEEPPVGKLWRAPSWAILKTPLVSSWAILQKPLVGKFYRNPELGNFAEAPSWAILQKPRAGHFCRNPEQGNCGEQSTGHLLICVNFGCFLEEKFIKCKFLTIIVDMTYFLRFWCQKNAQAPLRPPRP